MSTEPPSDLSISTCWNSHRHEDGWDLLSELKELGFHQVELSHGIRFSLWPGILKAVEEKLVSISSLHNFCPLPMGFTRANPNCYEFSDERTRVRLRAIKQTKETIDHASRFGAKAVVLHLGSTGQSRATESLEALLKAGKLGSRRFVELKLAAIQEHEEKIPTVSRRVREVLDEIVPHAEKKGVMLGFECREEIEEFPIDHLFEEWLARYPDSVVGYWHDFGHAARKDAIGFIDHEQHLDRLGSKCIGCHFHDFKWPVRDHCCPGKGEIPFHQYLPKIRKDALKVLELSPRVKSEDVQSCLSWWNALSQNLSQTGPS
ncbi:MAG: sugar phosphate isomerase/epimerase [Verrucomicrobiota bacterium]